MAKSVNREQGNGQQGAPANTATRPAPPVAQPPQPAPATPPPPRITMTDIVNAIDAGYGEKGNNEGINSCKKVVRGYLQQIMDEYPEVSSKYNIVILNDTGSIVRSDADKVYAAVSKFDNNNGNPKPILMILYSTGGNIGSAYLMGKLCLEFSNNNFVVTVPRYAKSAATLLACAAKEIHMGSLSELGPIDPQINSMPALGLKDAILHIAELVKNFPQASSMFADYLHKSLPLIDLGYYERAAESAQQYAEQLLITHQDNLPQEPKSIAKDLVYKYKDHGFVIEKIEAAKIFGTKVIQNNTKEYELGNRIYNSLSLIRSIAGVYHLSFYFIGSTNSDPEFSRMEPQRKED